MSFPKYPEYKDSGVEWLGEVPEHWATQRLKFIFAIKKRIAGAEGFDVLSITQQGIIIKDIEGSKGQFSDDYSKYQIVECGDFAMNGMDLLTGYVDLSIFYGVTSPDYRVFSLIDEAAWDKNYLLRLLQNGYKQKIFYAFGQGASQLGRWRFPTQAFNDFIFPRPSKAEQSAIATFLDRETAKIDTLVAEQEKLIELLKEKRQAVISHAVTKGLDPNVLTKDSGVEWLGDVPEHWKICRVKHACSHVVDCLHTTPTYEGEVEFPAIRTADVERGTLLLDQARLVSREIYEERIQRLNPKAGDILYSREGERFGMAALVPHGVDLCLGQRMMMFRTQTFASSEYLMWTLNSDSIYKQVLERVGGSTSPHVNISDIVNFHVSLPPGNEQAEIARHINGIVAELDPLIVEATRTIDLLKERRSALISAAVTGKIDVRGLAEATQ